MEARAAPLGLEFGSLLTDWRRVVGWFLVETVPFLKKLECRFLAPPLSVSLRSHRGRHRDTVCGGHRLRQHPGPRG